MYISQVNVPEELSIIFGYPKGGESALALVTEHSHQTQARSWKYRPV